RRTDVGRLHTLDFRRASEPGANRLADDRLATVAAHKIGAGDRYPLAAVEIAGNGGDAALVLGESLDCGAVENADARWGCSVREQHRLEIDLIDPVRRFRRWPLGVRPLGCGVSLGSRRDSDA